MWGLFSLCCFLALAYAQDPDLQNPPQNLQTLPTGSYIIPMSTAHQNIIVRRTSGGVTYDSTEFNLKAYGLIVNLLYANIPVRWAIRSNKVNPNDIDFVAYSRQVYPTPAAGTTYTATNFQFSSGPFFIPPAYMYPPAGGGLSRADAVITAFGQKVAVFRVLADASVDVRYTLQFKPKIGVLDDVSANNPNNLKIHTKVLANAGLTGVTSNTPNGHYQVISSSSDSTVGANTCFTLITEPHWDATYATAVTFNKNIRSFLDNGGNFLGQCEGIEVFENCDNENMSAMLTYNAIPSTSKADNQCNGLLLTEKGLYTGVQNSLLEDGDGIIRYRASATSFAQVETFVPTSGWIESFDLKRTSTSILSPFKTGTGAHFVFSADDSTRGSNGFSFAAHGKMPAYMNQIGGNVFYVGGHDYSGGGISKEGGQRLFLNAMLHPAYRPACAFEIPPQPEEKECILFDPWDHRDFIFTPGCIPHITLDPGVGTATKDCDRYIALPEGWEIVTMTTPSSPGVHPKLNPAETQNVADYGTAWAQQCIGGIVPGKTPSPTGTTASPANTWTGYLSGQTSTTTCPPFTVDDTVIDANTGRRCYKVSCGTSLLIRRPEHDPKCNSNNYGQYCDPATGSSYYTSSLSFVADTIYINLAGSTALQVPFQVPLDHQANIFGIIDSFNVDSTSDKKDMKSVARTLSYIWDYGTYDARAVGWGYNTNSGDFQSYFALNWARADVNTAAKAWSASKNTGNSVTGSTFRDSPILLTLTQAASAVSWSPKTFREFWVVTKSLPRAAHTAGLVTAFSDNGPGAGIFVIFVTVSGLTTTYQNICNQLPRCSVVTVTAYPNLEPYTSSSSALLEKAEAQNFIGPIFSKSASMVGRLTVKELDDTYNFVTPPSDTWLTTGVTNAPTWATQPGLNFIENYPTRAAAFLLPPNWVGPQSTSKLPVTINFKVIETGFSVKTVVSWNEPPILKVPTVNFEFKDADSTPFYVPIIDSIRSSIDPNFNIMAIKFLSLSFVDNKNWVNRIDIKGGTSNGVALPLTIPPATQWYDAALGLSIYPKASPAGKMVITYQLTDKCLNSEIGTINVVYTLANAPPTALDIIIYMNVDEVKKFDLRDRIHDVLSPDSALAIMILNVDVPLGTLQYKTGETTYGNLPTLGTTSSVSYQDLQFTAGKTSGTTRYRYRVIDEGGLYADASIIININKPPTISINPKTVTTAPTEKGTWVVTMTDTPTDELTLVLEARTVTPTNTITTIITSMSSTNPVGSAVNLLSASLGDLIVGIPISNTPVPGTVNIPMEWTPSLSHPYGTQTTLTFYAVDDFGLRSLTSASVTLDIPKNEPPVWRTTTPTPTPAKTTTSLSSWSYEYPQNTGDITFVISGDDVNKADTEKLTWTVTNLPDPAKGTLFYINSAGTRTQLTAASPTIPLSADKSTPTDGKTTYNLVYVPNAAVATSSVIITDFIRGFWTDPAAANSDTGVINLTFTLVNKRPTCSSLSATATQGKSLPLLLAGSDPDGNLRRLRIKTQDITQSAGIVSDVKDPASASIVGISLPKDYTLTALAGSSTWAFSYFTDRFATVEVDTFTYTVLDELGLESTPCTVTITTEIVNQPPVVTGYTYTIDEGATLPITFWWPSLPGGQEGPVYSDVDGTQSATTMTLLSPLVSTIAGKEGTWTRSGGSAIAIGQTSATWKTSTDPVVTYVAPEEIAPGTQSVVTFTFNARDSVTSPLVSKTSNTATVTIRVNPVDDPPRITLTPATIVTDPNNWVRSFTVTVTDVDSDVAVVQLTDPATGGIPWPVTSTYPTTDTMPDGTQLGTIPTIVVKDNGGTTTKTYTGDTPYGVTADDPIITLNKVGGVFPTFTITWDARSKFLADKLGSLQVKAVADGQSSNIATGNLQFLYSAPPNQLPTTEDVLIVIDEDSCALASSCITTFRPVKASDPNTQETEGDILTVSLGSTTSKGQFVYQSNAADTSSRAKIAVPSSTLTTGFLSQVNTVTTPHQWLLSYEPILDENSGTTCACTGGTSETDYSKCTDCSPIVVPFTILDSKGGVSTSANLRVVILPRDDPPLSQSLVLDAEKDTLLAVNIPATDVDGDLVCIVFEKTGTVVFDNPTLTYTTSTVVLNHDKVPADDTFCMTKAASSTFVFEFLSASTNAVSNVYPFRVRDEKNNLSPLYTLTINLPRTPLAPLASGTTVTGKEDEPIFIPINYKDSTAAGPGEGTYKDPDGTVGQTYLVITDVPLKTEGTLYGPSGEEITVDTPVYVQNPQFTFVPTAEWSGTTSFQFKSVDSETLESPKATVNIIITPVDDPPTITMTPLKIVNDRGVPGTFTVTVNDIDSTEVGVLILKDGTLDLFSMPAESTFTFPAVGGVTTPVPSTGLVKVVTLPAVGTETSFDMIWTPLASIPDTATGTFTLYAANENTGTPAPWDGLRSATSVTGNVGVLTKNNPPKVVVDAAWPYEFYAVDGMWTEHIFRLIGDDPDVIHADVLKITITQIPEGLSLTTLDGTPLKVGDELFTPGPTGGDPVDDLKTFAPVKIFNTPGSPPFIGSTSLAFTVTDLVGATSSAQNIPITIIRGNVPPTSSDEILVLPEDYCTTQFCGVTTNFATLKSLKYATLSARDENGDKIWIKFFSLPGEETTLGDPTTKTGLGTTAWFPFGETESDYLVLNAKGPFSKPGVVLNPQWDFWFQPALNVHSATATAGDSHALTFDGVSYRPYSAITFKVYDVNPAPVITRFPDEETAKGDTLLGCLNPVCDESPATCDDPAANGWVCTEAVDLTGHESALHTLRIYVIPVNDPPTSQSLSYTINEDDYTAPGQYLKIDIPFVDVDSTPAQIGVQTLGYVGEGTFYTRNGQGLVEPLVINRDGIVTIPRGDRELLFRPDPNVFSDPGKPLVTLNFKVYDQGPLFSPIYDVKIYVNSVPDAPKWIKEKEITILEDSSATITLSGRDERWSSDDDGQGVIFITSVGAKGTFTQCNQEKCVILESGKNLPFPLREGKINYKPLPDENGLVNGDGSRRPDGIPTYFYTSFNFKLWVYPGDDNFPNTMDDIPVSAIGLEINYRINVLPVNDPPVLVPLWNPPTGSVVNECDEDTFLRVRFTATDIDSDCNTLEADALIELDRFQATMYTCAPTTPVTCVTDPYQCPKFPGDCSGTTTVANCAVKENKIATIGRVKKIGPAQWEVSFVPAPNWNGNLLMKFIVWDECTPTNPDCDLVSEVKSALIHVRPINDAPSIVKGSTKIHLEYYNDNRDAETVNRQSPKRAEEPFMKPGDNKDDFTLISMTQKEGSYEVYEGDAEDERKLQGRVIEKYKPPTTGEIPENPDEEKPMVTVYRLKTQVQDIDFFFQYSLLMDSSLIHGSFLPQLISPSAPCVFSNSFTASCTQEIRSFNNFLGNHGFAITIDDEATSAIGLFMLNDTGNVDKLNRPAAAGFTIIITKEIEDEELVTPIAAIVILPVIAAATAATIAAAWILLGQRAQDYVGASFDAFTVSTVGAGTQSPLYNDLGREVHSPLYEGQKK